MKPKKTKKFQLPKPESPVKAKEIESGLNAIKSFGNSDADLYIKDDNNFFSEEFTMSSVITQEELTRLIKKIERLVRGSYEYKQYLAFIYEYLQISKCSVFSNISFEDGVELEFHHTPLTLFDICSVVIGHRFANEQPVTTLSVADEVMQAHCRHTIGLVPLSSTAHRLVHADIIKIHHSQLIGNWVKFLREYKDGVTGEIISKCLNFTKTTVEQVEHSYKKFDIDINDIRIAQNNEHERLAELQSFVVLANSIGSDND